ncbi:hypothetical protein ILUMI_09664 [Ignelater luminosus]|uniref:Uncharacterized protein n=1 Tax=Ignelater luminosus TaxID=2038154 RepID=A0A8K0D8P5_IGNLU|nr:hypothetical protein ILUMI_09664 [Ignelater luminosus]
MDRTQLKQDYAPSDPTPLQNSPASTVKTLLRQNATTPQSITALPLQNKSMKEAGREESELAKKYGEVDKDDIRVITVVADGAWCKCKTSVDLEAIEKRTVGQTANPEQLKDLNQ